MEEIKKDEGRFYLGEDGQCPQAEITFCRKSDGTIAIEHTYVGDELRGCGIARKLLDQVVETARLENRKIVPVCSYAKKVMTGNEEFKDILK